MQARFAEDAPGTAGLRSEGATEAVPAMANPVILVVDDDPQVLRAVERELRGRFGSDYRVVAAGSGADALDAIRRLILRGTPIALLVVDQRMPGMTGVELLGSTLPLLPGTKRVLLTAYADTDVAIRAINEIGLDHYLLKPWDPPEERLLPALAELLDDWRAGWIPPFDGVRLVGHRWSARAHEIKDYLARNQVPYRWVDVESDPEAARLVASAGIDPGRDPLLVFADGSHLRAPSNVEIAEKVGLRTRAALPSYDLVIIGGGPAGLAAAVYGASEGLRTLLLEREAPGGQAGTTSRIENYLGFPAGLTGSDLARRAVTQATRLGAEILTPQEVQQHPARGPVLVRHARRWDRDQLPGPDPRDGRAVPQAGGAGRGRAHRPGRLLRCRDHRGARLPRSRRGGRGRRQLGRPGRRLPGRLRPPRDAGGPRGRLEAGMSQYLVDQIAALPGIEVRLGANVSAVRGTDELEAITITDPAGPVEVPMQALFLFVGALPRTEWLGDLVERDGAGFIVTGPALSRVDGRVPGWPLAREPLLLETNVPGIFAAGDVRARSVKRIASGVGEGAMAVQFVHQYLSGI